MSDIVVPFNRPSLEGRELEYAADALRSGHTSSSGPNGRACSKVLVESLGCEAVLLTTSCTDALELAAMQIGVGPGDVVVVPDFTFTSTGLAFARAGATLRFCDIEATRLGLDPERLAELMDDRVKAVVMVHYAGVPCDVDGITAVLEDWPDAVLVEDNAHGLYGRWRNRPLGRFGRFAAQSFHETKNFNCGEGGALVVNDPSDVDRLRVLYDKGTDRQAFLLGQVDKYSWRDVGSSFGLADTLAAVLRGQLEVADRIQRLRRSAWERYRDRLVPLREELGFELPSVPDGAEPAYHLFPLLVDEPERRDAALVSMRSEGVVATFHYLPLSRSDAGRRFRDPASPGPDRCPISESVSGRLLRLPFFNRLTDDEIDLTVQALARGLREAQHRR